MLGTFSYLAILVACLVVTAPLEWVLGARVYRRPRRLAATLLIAMTPFVVWDLVGIARGHWDFAPDHTLGLDLFGVMPLEELLFFVVIPVCALLTHQAVLRLGARLRPQGRLARELAATTDDDGTGDGGGEDRGDSGDSGDSGDVEASPSRRTRT